MKSSVMTRAVLWHAFLLNLFLGRLLCVPWLALAPPDIPPEPWFEVGGDGGKESHDSDTRETPASTPASPPAETVVKTLPLEGLPFDLDP